MRGVLATAPAGLTNRDAAALKARMREVLAPFHAMDALTYLSDKTAMSAVVFKLAGLPDPELGLEAEYLACLLLERASPDAGATSRSGSEEFQAAMSEAIRLATELHVRQTRDAIMAVAERGPSINTVAAGVALDDTLYRWPGELPQVRYLLKDLFAAPDEVSQALRRIVGFDGSELLRLEEAVDALASASLQSVIDGIHSQSDEGFGAGDDAEDAARVKRAYELLLQSWDYTERCFTADDLARKSSVPTEAVSAFLDLFSIGFGELRGGRALMTGRNEVRWRPLVRDAYGRLLVINFSNLGWSIRPTLERKLHEDTLAWNAYEPVRASWLEDRAAALMEAALGEPAVRNVGFRLSDAPEPRWEADAVIRVDNVTFVIEAKAGAIRPKARIRRKREVRQDLGALLRKSSCQASRLAKAIRQREPVRFLDRRSSEPVQIDLRGVDRVEPVVVTLEDLSPFAADIASLRGSDLIAQDVDVPWVVNIFDLEVISASTEFAAQLTAYVSQRRRLDARVWFNGETDVWAAFLTESLDIAGNADPIVYVIGHGDPLRGWLPNSPPPSLPMRLRASQHRRLRRFHRDREAGWLRKAETVIAEAQRGRRLTSAL